MTKSLRMTLHFGKTTARPQPPSSLFQRIYDYHQQQNGYFGVVHDLPRGEDGGYQGYRGWVGGFSPRIERHPWADQTAAVETIAAQLKPGGSFAAATFGAARFRDARVQDIWERIMIEDRREPRDTINVMARSQDRYNVAPLDERFFQPGVRRIFVNMETGVFTGILPPENRFSVTDPDSRSIFGHFLMLLRTPRLLHRSGRRLRIWFAKEVGLMDPGLSRWFWQGAKLINYCQLMTTNRSKSSRVASTMSNLLTDCLRGSRAVFLGVSTNDNIPGCRMGQDTALGLIKRWKPIRAESRCHYPETRRSSNTIDDQLSQHTPPWV
ncbi:hypothetical protein Asppvi_001737 [Aspergillus pseudoviridinutans]|uniref:Uncharacterized protein n=1 Tax=Aspergillus pseudoviridinutans TaxID=1517512 RepID=A0A9P3B2F6_9EURO|nr:uncharacterized protein Asppvi_001737 [Aspergillus pseudoviridinutans]GIJ83217.1 hypothetical protein Asppvi_001737 [Aspergillus pseudoviridinutans]